MGLPEHIRCGVSPTVVWRLKIDAQVLRTARPLNKLADAVEAAIAVVERGGEIAAEHRGIIEATIAQEKTVQEGTVGLGPDLTELLSLVDARQRGDDVAPPACTKEQLLGVPCPTCNAAAGAYCELRPGKVLLLPQHHAERFWAARQNPRPD